MKQFVLFGGDVYYACGGWLDLKGDYADLESAWAAAQTMFEQEQIEWWQIVDLNLGTVVSKSESQAHA